MAFLGVLVAALFLNSQASRRLRLATEAIEQSASNEVQNAYAAATNQLARQFEIFARDASNRITQAYSTVTNQIADEFQTPRIHQVVEGVATNEARAILEKDVRPTVEEFRRDSLFIRTIARARAYDFKAYQQLLEIGKSTNENATLASSVVGEIDRALERDRSDFVPRRVYLEYFGTNSYGGPFSSDELVLRFAMVAQNKFSLNREGFVNTVAELKQPLFLPSLIEFFTNETDLAVADRLTLAISDLAKQDFHPHDYERIMSWWSSNHMYFTNWPLATFEAGSQAFGATKYADAVQAFEAVLKLDSTADMTRAYAIACYWEIAQTNQAKVLAKNFNRPAGRWAHWAAAKAELEGGSRSNATFQFFRIATNFPSMTQRPGRYSHVYRNLDWSLYEKLSGTNAP